MNIEQINNLSDRELEAAIAENLMGWQWEDIIDNSQYLRGLASPEDKDGNGFMGVVEHRTKGMQYNSYLPGYLTDYNLIFGKGGVIEKMTAQGFTVEFYSLGLSRKGFGSPKGKDLNGWAAVFAFDWSDEKANKIHASNLPEAILKAALLAKTKDEVLT